MIGGSCFTGAGLLDFGFYLAGYEIAWQIEWDKYCQKLLNIRWPDVKRYKNIKEVKKPKAVDIIWGGPPCQPFSVAGKQRGKDDDRYLWPEMFRIVRSCKPRYVVIENVPGIVNFALESILHDLEREGYATMPPIIFPAHAIGAPHKRDRIWIVAYTRCKRQKINAEQTTRTEQLRKTISNTSSKRCNGYTDENQEILQKQKRKNTKNQQSWSRRKRRAERDCAAYSNTADTRSKSMCEREKRTDEIITNTDGEQCEEQRKQFRNEQEQLTSRLYSWWETESTVGRVVDGCTNRVDRLKCLGNGVVVQVAYFIAKTILQYEIENRKEQHESKRDPKDNFRE